MPKTSFHAGVAGGEPATVVTPEFLNAINNPTFDGIDADGSFTLPHAESINDPNPLSVVSAPLVQEAIRNQAGASSVPTRRLGEIEVFLDVQTPPAGWMQADGTVVNAADVNFPAFWEWANQDERAWLRVDLPTWQSMQTAAGGVGGVQRIVVDVTAKTIKLPDLRGDSIFFAGNGATVGDWQGDAIRNITGDVGWQYAAAGVQQASPTSALYYNHVGDVRTTLEAGNGYDHVVLDASRSVPTASENRPRRVAGLVCICVEPALAALIAPTTTSAGVVYKYDDTKDASDPLNQRDSVFVTPAQAAEASAPDDHYYDVPVTLDPQVAEYASGYITMKASIATNSTIIISIMDGTNVMLEGTSSSDNTGSTNASVTIRVGKGKTFKYSYFGTINSMTFFRFVYDVGSYVDGMPNDNPKYPII